MSDDIQTLQADCPHEAITTWRLLDGTPAGLWSCTQCARKFVPLELDTAAAADAAEMARLLARYRDETPLGLQPHMIAHKADEALGRA